MLFGRGEKMSYGIKAEVWGDYALFTRPELKVERMSYDVITPSAARGILEAVMWKPAIRYVIDKIHVYNEPEFANIKRNEVSEKISCKDIESVMKGKKDKACIYTQEIIQQRNSTVLKNVHYIIEAHFEMTDEAGERDNEAKFHEMILRRLEKGQCYHQPYFGCREFPAKFRAFEGKIPESPLKGTRDLGFMLYDMDYSKSKKGEIQPVFFRCIMQDGVIDLTNVKKVK